MLPVNIPTNIVFRSGKTIFILILVIITLLTVSLVSPTLNTQEMKTSRISSDPMLNDLKSKLAENEGDVENNSFDIESLFTYIASLYEDEGIFLEAAGGYPTSIATYEALSILRFFGLDYYQFGSNWQSTEVTIADKLLDLSDESGSGGYALTPEISSPTLDGTFGVTTSLWIMNELPLKLKPITGSLIDFLYNTTFDKTKRGFHEVDKDLSIKATFQALTILDLIYQLAIRPEPELQDKVLSGWIQDFFINYSTNLSNFLNSSWIDSYFYSYTPYRTKIEDTWYALRAIEILDRFTKLFGISLPTNLTNYRNPVINWLKSLKKTIGPTKGGFGTSEYANVSETGMSLAILHLLNATIEINHTDTISFIYASQFIKRENRTYHALERVNLGGFGPNNRTYRNSESNNRINIHDTYFAALTLLLTGDIFNAIELSLVTSHYKDSPNINKTNLIIQGQTGTIEQHFTIFNYKSHGSLELLTVIDEWNLTHPAYTESNAAFYGKSDALYEVNLREDSGANFNWTLGIHNISNMISIRNLPVIRSPTHYSNSTIFVGYANAVNFDPSVIRPGDNINVTILYQNHSVLTDSTQNITYGSVSADLESPNGQKVKWFEPKPINTTIGGIEHVWNVDDQAMLGTWELTLTFNQSNFELVSTTLIEVTDTVFYYNISKLPQYFPGNSMDLNISLKYTNGNFTTNANASVVFSSNKTQRDIFSLTLEHLDGNIYTSRGSNCPTRYLFGFYNVSIRLTWNSSSGLQIDSIFNDSLPVINIEGIPTISEAFLKTDYRKEFTLEDNNLLYYGENINLSLKIGFKANSSYNTIDNETVVVIGGLVNSTDPSSFIQLFQSTQHNSTHYLSGLINTNLPKGIFGTRFQIQSEWNDSFEYLRIPDDNTKHAEYNLSLMGTFEISDVHYMTTEISEGLYHYALDTSSVLSISFSVINSDLNNISVPNLNLYGTLDIKDKVGTLNQSLPSITSALDQNGTSIYLLTFPISSLTPNKYQIQINAWTAISNHLNIGQLSPGFKISKTFPGKPIIQLHEAILLVTGIIFIILVYLNLRKYR